MAEQIIKLKRWPPCFDLCSWCNQGRVAEGHQRWCRSCKEVIERDRMGGYRDHDMSIGDDARTLGLFPFGDIII